MLTFIASFKSVDPTPCHQSAHPIQHDSRVAFSVRDTESEEPNTVTVSEITTRHLKRLAASASDYLGQKVTAAVITVPTNFSSPQKDALSEASKNAGIEVLQFIHEPVAAVLAYDARNPSEQPTDKIVVVVDLGGIRSDIAVIASRGGIYTILATAHDYDVSGAQLDKVLIDFFAKEFLKKNKSAADPRQNARSLAKLTAESEAVKKALSLGSSASFSVESLSDGLDFTTTINRTRYELLANKMFAALSRLVLGTVEKAGLDSLDVSEVILSGGTSHTPRIAQNLQSAFPEHVTVSAPSTRPDAINPSELAARGAAIQASLIAEFDTDDVRESCHPVVTATPHLSNALGVLCISASDTQGVFHPLIEAATAVPVRRVATFGVPAAGGDVIIKLCEATSQVVTKQVEKSSKAATNGEKDDDDDEDDEDESDDEDEEVREKKWTVGSTIAEAAIRGVKKGAKVEVQVNVGPDLAVTLVCREVGAKGGVRGVVHSGKGENGSA
jgi:molecular chaperone DnaK (HSP70)